MMLSLLQTQVAAHLLPLSLARLSNRTALPLSDEQLFDEVHDVDVEFARSCPSTSYLFPQNENKVLAMVNKF